MHKRLNHVIQENTQFQECEVRSAAPQKFLNSQIPSQCSKRCKIIGEIPGSFQNLTDHALATTLGIKTKYDLGSW